MTNEQTSKEHEVRFYRYHRGMTPIRPSRPVYGYKLECKCGWSARINGQKREATKRANYHKKTGE